MTPIVPSAAQQQPAPGSYPWTPDQGDGTYRNPIIFADYSDPDVIRVGEDFWLIASSFHCTPGLPILHSRDLVNWTIVNHAIKNLPGEMFDGKVQRNCGIWAPAIRYHDRKFWIFWPDPDAGIYVQTADDPRGQWSPPHLMVAGKGLIDPCPVWDDDGKAYLVHAYAGSRAGIKNRLRVAPMAPDGSKLLDEGRIVFHEPEKHPTLEGPKFLKKDGWYYILAPAGGVTRGWQVVLRSRDIYGPYEDKIVLAQGKSPINGPHQGALVDLANGEWWFIHFQDRSPYGRITHLQPVTWKDGWPMMGINPDDKGVGEPVLRHRKPNVGNIEQVKQVPQTSDEFDDAKLGLQWQWHANHKDEWANLTARNGWLRLQSIPADPKNLKVPNLLMQKLPAESFVAETSIDVSGLKPGEIAGLTVMGSEYAMAAFRRMPDKRIELVRFTGDFRSGTREIGAESWQAELTTAQLRVSLRSGGDCAFSYSLDGGTFHLLKLDYRATSDGWIGAKVGIFCIATAADAKERGHADFDYFRFQPLTAP